MNKNRTRNWFITINENTNCFSQIKNIMLGEVCSLKHYAYILHYKDNEEQPHVHMCLEYNNARTLTQIKAKFNDAHIEVMEYKNKSYQCLINKNDADKFQYDINDVCCDDRDYLTLMLNNKEYEKLDAKNLIEKINSGVNTYAELILIYGLHQVNKYHKLISKILAEKLENQNEKENR